MVLNDYHSIDSVLLNNIPTNNQKNRKKLALHYYIVEDIAENKKEQHNNFNINTTKGK